MSSFLTQKSSDLSASSFNKSYNRMGSDFNETKIQNNYSVDRIIYDLKIILVGNSGVGKTSLLGTFLGENFDSNYKCTVTAETKTKNLIIDINVAVNLNIWDTCGQEKFRSLTKSFFRDAHGILLVYDVSDQKSFDDLKLWLKEIKEGAPETSSIILVGNKIDLNRVVSNQDANDFVINNKLQYVEVSCLEGRFIETPFQIIATDIVNKIKKGEIQIEQKKEEDEEEKEPAIKISDSQHLQEEFNIINKKERKREKEVKCCL